MTVQIRKSKVNKQSVESIWSFVPEYPTKKLIRINHAFYLIVSIPLLHITQFCLSRYVDIFHLWSKIKLLSLERWTRWPHAKSGMMALILGLKNRYSAVRHMTSLNRVTWIASNSEVNSRTRKMTLACC